MVLNKPYQNVHGEDIKVTGLSYFISNISLRRQDGNYYVVPQDSSYFVIKHTSDTILNTITIKGIPEGQYSSIKFLIGVDSLRNTMGVSSRRGNLDMGGPAKGMYWVWNSGYIFIKLEGISSFSPEKFKNRFTYHIGGFGGYKSKTINSLRGRELHTKVLVKSGIQATPLKINVNLDRFFFGAETLKISEKPNVMWGIDSEMIADNFKESFEINE